MIEGTGKNDVQHGLVRTLNQHYFDLELHKEDVCLATLTIYFVSNEALKNDPHGYFADLELSNFMDHEIARSLKWIDMH